MSQYMLLGSQTTEFTCGNIYPFCPLHRTTFISFGFPIVHYSRKPHPSQMRLVRWDYNRLLGRTQSCWNEDLEEFFHTVCSHLTNFNKSPLCLRALRGRPPRNGANSRCQASYKWGVKWFGWNLTNWTGSYDPALNQVLWWMNLASFPRPASFLLL